MAAGVGGVGGAQGDASVSGGGRWWLHEPMCDDLKTTDISSLCPFLGFDIIIKEEATAGGNWMKNI